MSPPLNQFCDINLTHPTNTAHLLPSFHTSFTSNWKRCSLANIILIHHLSHAYLPASSPNIIHHSRLTVYLHVPYSLDRDPLRIDVFVHFGLIDWGTEDNRRIYFCTCHVSFLLCYIVHVTNRPSVWSIVLRDQRSYMTNRKVTNSPDTCFKTMKFFRLCYYQDLCSVVEN